MHLALSTIKAFDKIHLRDIMEENIKEFGTKCNFSHIDVSDVTDMGGLFKSMKVHGQILDWGISDWDVSNVTNMNAMFIDTFYNGDLSKWNVSKVKDMGFMFSESTFNDDISAWDVSNVRNMHSMFLRNKNFIGDLSQWNTASVNVMNSLFRKSIYNGDIAHWNTSKVNDMGSMFAESSFSGDISKWDFTSLEYYKDVYNHHSLQHYTHPNVFVWATGLNNMQLLKPEWREHLQNVREMLESFYNNELDVAKGCHLLWLEKDLKLDSLPIELAID